MVINLLLKKIVVWNSPDMFLLVLLVEPVSVTLGTKCTPVQGSKKNRGKQDFFPVSDSSTATNSAVAVRPGTLVPQGYNGIWWFCLSYWLKAYGGVWKKLPWPGQAVWLSRRQKNERERKKMKQNWKKKRETKEIRRKRRNSSNQCKKRNMTVDFTSLVAFETVKSGSPQSLHFRNTMVRLCRGYPSVQHVMLGKFIASSATALWWHFCPFAVIF